MDRYARLALLEAAAVDDREHGLPGRPRFQEGPVELRPVRLAGQGTTQLMRVMQTNACSLSCVYCPMHRGAPIRRVALSPEDVARTFMESHRAGIAQGLFLTSGVPGRPEQAMDRLLASVEILRRRERFTGYVHLKLLPGAQRDQVEEATRLATRVSVNLEAPRDDVVRALAPEKDLAGDLLPALALAGRLSREARLDGQPRRAAPAGTTTQFVVGARDEADRDILALVHRLEVNGLLHHAHFSAFQPVAGTAMEGNRPTAAARELRLYQAEHLLRWYGFGFQDLVFGADGNLPPERDPKTAWALAHPERFPVEVLHAPYGLLLRVPGIGPAGARRLLKERHRAVLRDAGDLRRLGVDIRRAGFYLTLRGRRLARARVPEQLGLFAPGGHLPSAVWRTATPPCAYR